MSSESFSLMAQIDSSLLTSNNVIIHSPKPTNIANLFSWAILYFPSRARFAKIAKKVTIINTRNIGRYLINGININTRVTTRSRRNDAHHHNDCLRWNCSNSLFFWLLNATTMIPIRRYIITALFFSVLLGTYISWVGSTVIGVLASILDCCPDILDCNVSSI